MGKYDQRACPHPTSRMKKFDPSWQCTLCFKYFPKLDWAACIHKRKLGKCEKCRKSQRLIGDFDGKKKLET
jgi:hypothetical protein